MEEFNKLNEGIRKIVQRLEQQKEKLETALEERGFADVVQVIQNEMEHKNATSSQPPRKRAKTSPAIIATNALVTSSVSLVNTDVMSRGPARFVHPVPNSAVVIENYRNRNKLILKIKWDWDHWNFKDLIKAFPLDRFEHIQVPSTIVFPSLRILSSPEPLHTWFRIYGSRFNRIEISLHDNSDKTNVMEDTKSTTKTFFRLLIQMPNLTELHIDHFQFEGECPFGQAITHLSNLKVLKINNIGSLPVHEKSLASLLRYTTGVEYLTLGIVGPKKLVTLLTVCNNEGYLKNLFELHLPKAKLSLESLELLTSARFTNLRKLSLTPVNRFEYDQLVANSFAAFIETLRNTLRVLSGGLLCNQLVFRSRMKKLSKIQSQASNDHPIPGGICFANMLPQLETFNLTQIKGEKNVDEIFANLFPRDLLPFRNSSLKELNLVHFPVAIGPLIALSLLVKSFPGIETLSICADKVSNFNDFFKLLADLKKLKDLTFSCGGSTRNEDFLTASLRQDFRKLLALKRCTIRNPKMKLILISQVFSEGFMHAPSLLNLRLEGFTLGPETETAIEALKTKGVQLKLLNCYLPTADD